MTAWLSEGLAHFHTVCDSEPKWSLPVEQSHQDSENRNISSGGHLLSCELRLCSSMEAKWEDKKLPELDNMEFAIKRELIVGFGEVTFESLTMFSCDWRMIRSDQYLSVFKHYSFYPHIHVSSCSQTSRTEKESENRQKLLDSDGASLWFLENRKHIRGSRRDDWLHMLSFRSMNCYKTMEWKGDKEKGGEKGEKEELEKEEW